MISHFPPAARAADIYKLSVTSYFIAVRHRSLMKVCGFTYKQCILIKVLYFALNNSYLHVNILAAKMKLFYMFNKSRRFALSHTITFTIHMKSMLFIKCLSTCVRSYAKKIKYLNQLKIFYEIGDMKKTLHIHVLKMEHLHCVQ